MKTEQRILWADDEIDLLRAHILFLENKGYRVTAVTNGADAIAHVEKEHYDLVFLDEQMPGMDGLATLEQIKATTPELPVVMITKSEEEHIMEDAIGGRISDYLIKPVNPSQILLTCKKLLDESRIRGEKASQDYLQAFNKISTALDGPMDHPDWTALYRQLVRYDLALEEDDGLRQVFEDQHRAANKAFGRYIEKIYPDWIAQQRTHPPDQTRPLLSHEIMPVHVFPHLRQQKPVFFFLIDCLRYDQWLAFESVLYPLFEMDYAFHYSILPTATPFSRNAIFSGLLPMDIAKRYPQVWANAESDEHSRNRNEEQFLKDQLRQNRIEAKVQYEKLLTSQDGGSLAQAVKSYTRNDLTAIVVNFMDILAHSRSDSDVLKEIAPDERAYRALTRTWFEHSWLFQAFQELAQMDCTIVLTTDHGVVRALHSTKVIGDRETSTSLRYKYGRNLKCDNRHAIFVRDPQTFGLPSLKLNTNFIIAKEDYYFVYPTNFHKFQNHYRDTLQHGGATLEEMILPVVTLTPR